MRENCAGSEAEVLLASSPRATTTSTTTAAPANCINNNHQNHHQQQKPDAMVLNCAQNDMEKGLVRLPVPASRPNRRPSKKHKDSLASTKLAPKWPRLVAKNGECIIRPNNLRNSYTICMRNWFHLIIEHSWRRIFGLFACSFLSSWLTFGFFYYLIVHYSVEIQDLSENRQCIANVHSFTSAFLFSLETQHTIGYGTRYMTESCPLAYAVLSLQCIVGVLLQTVLAGIVTAKILRPKKRKQEMRFSVQAVLGPVDDEDPRPALMIRLADIQHRLYIAESHVRLYMATTKINKRGECELIGVQDMNVGYDTGMDRVLLLWPVVIRHIIDPDSPLWEITEDKLNSCRFELIMTVEGIVEATGMAFQARTSFLPEDILWGRRFVPMITLNSNTNQFEVNYDLFDVTEPHAVEPWLPPEEVFTDEECPRETKLPLITESEDAPTQRLPTAAVPTTYPAAAAVSAAHYYYHNHYNNHMPNGVLEPPRGHYRFRRKSACSVVSRGSLDGVHQPQSRKTSKGSLLHTLLLRNEVRSGANDSSPLVASSGADDRKQSDNSCDDFGINDNVGTMPPTSPFVVHTLQHSGFT
uniref:IRK_C domain-containing protein n=1 Tax=Globodera pallida TaxID=36090 RepID=A0A183BNX9_GLOPA